MKNIIYLIVITAFTSCYNEDDFLLSNIDVEDFITLKINDKSLLADNNSQTTVKVFLPLNTKQDKRTVQLNCTNCTYSNGMNTIMSEAKLELFNNENVLVVDETITSSNKLSNIKIKSQIDTYQLTDSIIIERAFPEKLNIIQPAFNISYGFQTIALNTLHSRVQGVPSEKSKSTIIVVDSIGNKVGEFLNYSELTNTANVVENNFSLGIDTLTTNRIFAIATGLNNSNEIISDTITLLITK